MGIDDEFDQFVRGQFVALCRTGFLVCGDRHRAEDAAQEALLRVHAKWRRIDDHRAYARRALLTILVDESRRPWRRERPTDTLPPAQVADPSAASDDRDELIRALATLPRRQRACVVLRYYLDLSVADTAGALGIAEGNVKRTTSEGLGALRAALSTPVGSLT